MAKDVWNIVTYLGRRKAHLIGFSMGGMIAAKAASMYPERVLSLTLLSTPKYGMCLMSFLWNFFRKLAHILPRCIFKPCPLCRQGGCKEMMQHVRIFFEIYFKYSEYYLLGLTATTEDNASLVQRWRWVERQQQEEKYSPPPFMSLSGQMRAVLFHRTSHKEIVQIRSCSFPVLCIAGKYDRLVSEKYCRNFAHELNGHYVVLPGAHYIIEECAEQLHLLISLFLENNLKLPNATTPLYFV